MSDPMKQLLSRMFAATVLAVSSFTARAAVLSDGVFLETDFSNPLRVGTDVANSASVAIPAGGSVGEYPGPQGSIPSTSGRQIQLRQSVVGHAVAMTPMVVNQLLAHALVDLKAAVGHVNLTSETADHGRAEGQPWNIRFSGVVNPVNTNNSSFTYTDANFLPERAHQAADYYRAALRADPVNVTAAHGLLRTYYERMAAYTLAGHNGAERAARVRLLFGDIGLEIGNLEGYTLNFYTNATDELSLMTSRPVEAGLFDGSYLQIPAEELATNRNRLTEAYARAITHQAETIFKLGRLRQFNGYRNPVLDPTASQSFAVLLADLANHRRSLAERVLLLETASELTDVANAELGRARYFVYQIELLESSIENGRIAFVAAHDTGFGTPTQPDIQFIFREYAPDHVPFHALTSVGGVPRRAHEQFLETATSLLSRALQREQAVDDLSRNFDLNEFAHRQSLSELTNRYVGELGTLCGRIKGQDGALVPDVILALYPRTERLALHPYTAPGESLGEIGAQLARIDQALAELELAEQELESLYSQMEKKGEVSGQIAAGIDNLARMFLQNGEKLEGLDIASGNLQAEAAIKRARALQGNSWWNAIKRIGSAVAAVAGVVAAPATGGSSLAITAATASQVIGVADAYVNDSKSMKAAKIEARLARNLAKINAQHTRIATLEKVAVQYQQRDQVLLQTEEALHSLLLQAERQKLAILLAEQRVGSEFLALQNLVGRVQYLLQEFAGALALQDENPLRSPDYRLVRDLKLREAEDAFHLAHRWVYLAAKSVEYRVNTDDETTTLPITIAAVLRARNASSLEIAMANLGKTLDTFYEDQNREVSGLTPNYISFRNHIIQRNLLANEQDIAVAELQPGGLSSAEHWVQFLAGHLATNGAGVRQRLVIPFSTSLDRWPESGDPRFKNPLFGNDTHNDALAGPGIEIQITGTALNLGGLVPRFRLEYVGASAMRLEACAQTGAKQVRYWDIRRPDGSPYLAEGIPGVASTTSWGTGAAGFNEFSPANDRWNLIIDATQGQGAAANGLLLNQLESVTDIRIRFWTSYFPSADCQ